MTTLPNIGKPATNALQNSGITNLEQLTQYDEKTVLQLHGVGPKAVRILKETLESQNLSFKKTELPILLRESQLEGKLPLIKNEEPVTIHHFFVDQSIIFAKKGELTE